MITKKPMASMTALQNFGKRVKIPGLEGMSLYDLLHMYVLGIVRGALTSRAGGISYSFFYGCFSFHAVYADTDSLYSY